MTRPIQLRTAAGWKHDIQLLKRMARAAELNPPPMPGWIKKIYAKTEELVYLYEMLVRELERKEQQNSEHAAVPPDAQLKK